MACFWQGERFTPIDDYRQVGGWVGGWMYGWIDGQFIYIDIIFLEANLFKYKDTPTEIVTEGIMSRLTLKSIIKGEKGGEIKQDQSH